MAKFGTGSAQAIWNWWEDFHRDHVRNQGLVGIIKGIIPFILALIGTVMMGIIDAVVEFFKWIGGIFNKVEDDNARALINRLPCAEIRSLPDERLIELINSMLEGNTRNNDENAILKLLECISVSCDRLTSIVSRVAGGREEMESNFHGSQYEKLRILFANCGLISMSDWDDDTSKRFINESECSDLNSLSIENIMALLRNLFRGPTFASEERAINRLIGCLDPDVVRDLITRPGFSISDFDAEVDRQRWRDLKIIFRSKGIDI